MVPSDSAYDPAVHLSHGDVWTDSIKAPQYIEIAIKVSKTDPFRKGVVVYLARRHRDNTLPSGLHTKLGAPSQVHSSGSRMAML